MVYLSVDFCVLYFKKEHPSAEKMVCPGYCILALVEAVRSKGRSLSFWLWLEHTNPQETASSDTERDGNPWTNSKCWEQWIPQKSYWKMYSQLQRRALGITQNLWWPSPLVVDGSENMSTQNCSSGTYEQGNTSVLIYESLLFLFHLCQPIQSPLFKQIICLVHVHVKPLKASLAHWIGSKDMHIKGKNTGRVSSRLQVT